MSKIKTTRHELMTKFAKSYTVDMPHLFKLAGVEPFAYTSGVYGWNFDAYEVSGVLLCSGDRGMIGQRLEIAEKYEEKARKIDSLPIRWEEKKQKARRVWNAFVRELKGGKNEKKNIF